MSYKVTTIQKGSLDTIEENVFGIDGLDAFLFSFASQHKERKFPIWLIDQKIAQCGSAQMSGFSVIYIIEQA